MGIRRIDKNLSLVLLLIFLCGVFIKLPGAIFSPSELFYDLNELSTVFCTIALLAAQVPSGIILWSTGVIALPLLIVYLLIFFFNHPQIILAFLRHNPGMTIYGLSINMAEAFINPVFLLTIGRSLVAIFSSLLPLALFNLCYKKGKKIAAFVCASLFLFSPFFTKQSYSFMPDSLALTFFVFFIITILKKEEWSPRLVFRSGLFLGLAIAGKFTYIASLPIGLLAVCIYRNGLEPFNLPKLIRQVLIFIIGIVIPIFIFVPFIWTASLTLLKNILGNMAIFYSGESHCWHYLFINVIPVLINRWLLLFCAIGLFYSFNIFNKKTALLLGLNFFIFLFSLGQASFIYPRYALPLIPFLYLYAGLGIESINNLKNFQYKKILIFSIILIVSAENLIGVVSGFRITHQMTNAVDCITWVKKTIKTDSSIALPGALAIFFTPNETALKRQLEILHASSNDLALRVNNLFSRAKMQFEKIDIQNPVVHAIFSADDKNKIFISQLLLWYLSERPYALTKYDIFLYSQENYLTAGVYSPKDSALKDFLENKIDILITDNLLPTALRPIKNFTLREGKRYFLYSNLTESEHILLK